MKKHPLLKRIGSILLFLPFLTLLVYLVIIANQDISVEDVIAVRISDDKYEHRYEGRKDIEQYVSFVHEAKDGAVQQINEEAQLYKIVFELKNNIKKSYYFYPSLNGESLLVDGNGLVCKIDDARNILMRREYESLYADRFLPDANITSVDGGVTALPKEYLWNYKKSDSNFYSYTEAKTSDNGVAVDVSASALEKGFVNFSVSPDNMVISYNSNGKTSSNISELGLHHGDGFNVSVSAKWTKKNDSCFYGEGVWSFECIYNEAPLITLDKNNASAGDCVVIYADNIDFGEVLTIETDLITYKTPVVYAGYTRNFALLPIGLETYTGNYPLKISVNGEEFSFDLSVKNETKGFCTKNLSAELHNYVISPDGKKEYESFLNQNLSKTNNSFLWSSPVLLPPVDGDIGVDFGFEVLYNGLPPQLCYDGISYNVPERTEVKCAADGKVVFVGEKEKSGISAIVDHGCGIMSHYYHLSVVSALNTDTNGVDIKAGDMVGYSGKTGFTDVADMHFAVSINGIFVNPHLFFEENK